MAESRHVSVYVGRSVAEVYAYAADPRNLPAWAPGLLKSVENVDGQWVAESDMGRILLEWAPENPYGVLDHHVTVPSGERFYNPMRVTALGDGSEVVFSVRRQVGMTDAEFDRDCAAVQADLDALRDILERR
ncbi:SRPBCC family protein [Dactylosporangium aurantiacum]|uniref:SRPBCC family protein n=1 Tax=Dactylosporangium aurantiacum TaxID=35754 RepID=A0A9Q9IHC0_9ACTN|nr:SRPBCC family protein [Dactylosporangium aurantiacum]MDG6105488.1 SRPBCC family protein [Dactylosporangium aurantiacum]UWZ53977.1 SRPBCC family protein [Dactylosporangium aurantiacum]